MMSIDARIPVVFGPVPHAVGDIEFVEGEHFTPASIRHAPGCACCAPRSSAGRGLSRLLLARARGDVAFFRRVVAIVATEQARSEIEQALSSDPFAASCFVRAETPDPSF